MNIIFISNNSNRTKKIALTKTNVILISGAVLCVVLTLALILNFFSLRYAHQIDLPAVRAVLVNPQEERHQKYKHICKKILTAWRVSLAKCKRS